MPHLYTLDRKDLRGRVFPWSRAKAVARGRAWDLSCAQKGHQNLEWVADKVFHPACSMSDCLPSGLWLLVLWLWHVWTRSVFGKRSFLSRYQLTGLWHYCCPLLGSFFCAGNAFFHACFSGLGLFKSTLEKAAGPKSECPEKTSDLRPDASSRFGWITASVKGTKHWSQSAWESFLRFGKGKSTQHNMWKTLLRFKMLDLKNQSDLKWHLSDSKSLFVLFNLGPVSLA